MVGVVAIVSCLRVFSIVSVVFVSLVFFWEFYLFRKRDPFVFFMQIQLSSVKLVRSSGSSSCSGKNSSSRSTVKVQ